MLETQDQPHHDQPHRRRPLVFSAPPTCRCPATVRRPCRCGWASAPRQRPRPFAVPIVLSRRLSGADSSSGSRDARRPRCHPCRSGPSRVGVIPDRIPTDAAGSFPHSVPLVFSCCRSPIRLGGLVLFYLSLTPSPPGATAHESRWNLLAVASINPSARDRGRHQRGRSRHLSHPRRSHGGGDEGRRRKHCGG